MKYCVAGRGARLIANANVSLIALRRQASSANWLFSGPYHHFHLSIVPGSTASCSSMEDIFLFSKVRSLSLPAR